MRLNRKRVTSLILAFVLCLILSDRAFSEDLKYAFSQKDRDPFSPLIAKNGLILIAREINLTDLALRGIIYSPAGSVAIINGEVLTEGETIADYTILEIREKEVVLKKDNQGFTLKLEGE